MNANLKNAFKELRSNGIRACANFSCCNSCGHYEMGDTENYIFYSRQSKDYLEQSGQMYLQWKGNAPKMAEILSKYFQVDWNGDDNVAILIKTL